MMLMHRKGLNVFFKDVSDGESSVHQPDNRKTTAPPTFAQDTAVSLPMIFFYDFSDQS